VSAILLTSWFGSVSASLVGSSDVVTGLVVAIPVLIVAGGVAVGLRLRGKGVKDRVPTGEVASDAPTDIELARGAEATRRAEPAPAPPEASTATAAPEAPVAPPEAAAPIAPPEPAVPAEPASFRSRLGKARGLLSGYLGSVRSKGKIDASTWDDLEEALIRADVGVGATDGLLDDLRARVKSGGIVGPDALVDALKSDLVTLLSADRRALVTLVTTARSTSGCSSA
jgi:fused signal recognition particle receptor